MAKRWAAETDNGFLAEMSPQRLRRRIQNLSQGAILARLREAEQRVRDLSDGSLQGLAVTVDGRIVDTNKALCSMLGYSESELKTFDEWPLPMENARGRDTTRYVFRASHKDGSDVWLDILERPILWEGQSALQIAAIDITDRKRVEKDLLASKQRAEVADKAKNEFLANMSHELRTPLNSIMGYSEIMAKELLGDHQNPSYAEYSGNVYSAATHLLSLIDDLLDISRIEAGVMDINESEIDIGELLRSAMQIVGWRAEAKHQLVSVARPDPPLGLRGDGRYLRQVMINLLTNAVKYTQDRGVIKVGVRKQAGGALAINIKDSGIGIKAEDIPKILEPFGKVQSSVRQTQEGIGLGLPLSKKLVELHGGRLAIDSAVGAGTTVTIIFPPERTLSLSA